MKKLFRYMLLLGLPLLSLQAKADNPRILADLLYWHASQETASTWATTIASSGRMLDFDATNFDLGWNLGFRGGYLCPLNSDCWDTGFYWTYYPAKRTHGFSMGNQIVLPEFFSGFISDNVFFGAKLEWQLIMNMFDVELGKKFYAHDSLTIRPSIGIKGGTIHQHLNCQWDAGIYTATERLKNNFSGIGPSFGIETRWCLGNHVSLIGDFGTALMWGQWKVDDIYSRPSALLGLITPTTITTSMSNSKLGTSMYKCRLGLEWIYEGNCRLTFQLGYEMQFWLNQLRLPTFQQLPVHGNLTIQGATCQVRIDL